MAALLIIIFINIIDSFAVCILILKLILIVPLLKFNFSHVSFKCQFPFCLCSPNKRNYKISFRVVEVGAVGC